MVPLVYVPRVCFILLQVLMQATQGYTFSAYVMVMRMMVHT
jgi:hypothetical protein